MMSLSREVDIDWITSSLKAVDQKFLIANPWAHDLVLPVIIAHLHDLSGYYPGFNAWLDYKVIPGLLSGERSILLEHNRGSLSGLAIVKNDGLEKKLCCLRVLPRFQNTGVGLKLFERSFQTLGTSMPLLSIAEEQKPVFGRLFKYYGFELAKKYHDYYRPMKDELSFNGLIEAEPIRENNLNFSRKLVSLT
ncbi:GNAT family N-acetyltransferase [Pseudomonas sp. DCA-1]|uniref:GNAT family N-acetyltransferase n=1 Tax=Pseudomonas sp. DCA-1 TaxID=3344874 RepID=UPI0039778D8F